VSWSRRCVYESFGSGFFGIRFGFKYSVLVVVTLLLGFLYYFAVKSAFILFISNTSRTGIIWRLSMNHYC
jgi:hypothetical protein